MKKILLSMILLALCLIQASADTYYYKIQLTNENGQPGEWSDYIKVDAVFKEEVNGVIIYDYTNGLGKLLKGETVKAENERNSYTLPKKADNNKEVDLDRIYGIAFANGKGSGKSEQENILEGDEYDAWTEIRPHIQYLLDLSEYIRDTYTDDSYFMDMFHVKKLELPKGGMTVGNGDDNCIRYFANARELNSITIWSDKEQASVDITNYAGKVLKNRVGKFMFSNCCGLSTKYINRLIKDVTEIKDNAFYIDDLHRKTFSFSDEADNKMTIEIPNSVTKIGDQAFYNRMKVTGLNIQGNGCLEIGSEAFRECDELATIKQTNKELKIYKNAFMRCKQLNAFENLDKAKITYLGTGVFGDCRSMTNKFVNDVLQNYAANGGKKIPAYLFWG